MPAVPVSLFDPVWEQFSVLLPERPAVVPTHPLGCHRRRIPDRVVFAHVVAALVHGSGLRADRLAGVLGPHHPPPRGRVGRRGAGGDAAHAGVAAVRPHDRARSHGPRGGRLHHEGAWRRREGRPVPGRSGQTGAETLDRDRRRRGAPASWSRPGRTGTTRRCSGRPWPGWAGSIRVRRACTVHLDRGYDSAATRTLLADRGFAARSPAKAGPLPSRPASAGSSNGPNRG